MKLLTFVLVMIFVMITSARPAVYDVIPTNDQSAPSVRLSTGQRENLKINELRSRTRKFLRNQFRKKIQSA